MTRQPPSSHSRRAATLLWAHRRAVSAAVARQIQAAVPRYEHVDTTALARNIELLVEGAKHLLESGNDRRLIGVLNTIMDIRQASGFEVTDLAVAAIYTFPVTRRFFLEHAGDLEEGLAIYEAYEALLMPMVGKIVANFTRLSDGSATLPDGMPLASLFATLAEDSARFSIFPVDPRHDDEVTARDGHAPGGKLR